MLPAWEERSIISANLFNPAFCGEVLRRTIESYNQNSSSKFPYSLSFIILPIILHKNTREEMPLKSSSHFHIWVNEHEYLFIDFIERAKSLLPYTKEALLFLLAHNAVFINEEGNIEVYPYRKKNPSGDSIDEIKEIYAKVKLLGKWLSLTGNVQSIFAFLKIKP